MYRSHAFTLTAFLSLSNLLLSGAPASTDAGTISLQRATHIPNATLQPGKYTFEVEDRLQDRAIVRITKADSEEHYLVLAVPSAKLPATGRSRLLLFHAADADEQVIRGWKCSSCASALEFVYPKVDAVKITGTSAQPVLAVDPTYDKLPENLSADDMRVVTLWLLAPKHMTPDHRGEGVNAQQYAASKPAEAKSERASVQNRNSLPHTATNDGNKLLAGLAVLLLSVVLFVPRKQSTFRAATRS